MNLLDMIRRVLNHQDWKKASSLPGWRSRPTFKKKDRTPFQSDRKRTAGPSKTTVEEFIDKDQRNDRFNELCQNKNLYVTKFSTVKDFASLWCVAYSTKE